MNALIDKVYAKVDAIKEQITTGYIATEAGKTDEVKTAFEETFGAEVKDIMQEMKESLMQIAEKGLIPILEVVSD